MKLVRLILLALLAAVGAWIGRSIAHSKVPQPQGRWREIDPEELGSTI
jgi:hypothetical protein